MLESLKNFIFATLHGLKCYPKTATAIMHSFVWNRPEF